MSGDIVAVDLGDRILQRFSVNRIPCFNRVADDVVGIKAQCGVSNDGIVAAVVLNPLLVGIEPFLVALDKVGRNRVGVVVFIEECRYNRPLRILSARVVNDCLIVPGVACHDRCVDAHLTSLLDDQRCRCDGRRCEDGVCIRCLDLRQDRLEIGLVGLELLLGRDGSAERLELLYKEVRKTGRIVIADLVDHRNILVSAVKCVLRHDRALERIQEAHTEVVIAARGNLRVRAGSSDCRDLCICKCRSRGDRDAGAVAADHGYNLVRHQLLCSGHGLCLIGLVVDLVQLDLVLLSVDLDCRTDLIRVARTLKLLEAAAAILTCLRLKDTDLDGVICCERRHGHDRHRRGCHRRCTDYGNHLLVHNHPSSFRSPWFVRVARTIVFLSATCHELYHSQPFNARKKENFFGLSLKFCKCLCIEKGDADLLKVCIPFDVEIRIRHSDRLVHPFFLFWA